MVKRKERRTTTKVKKKVWVPIEGISVFKGADLGTTPVEGPSAALGKTMTANLMALTNDIKKQHINIGFLLTKIVGDQAQAFPVSYNLSPSFMKRIVRRNRDKIDDSFITKTAEGLRLRIKPVVLTANNAKNSVQKVLRKEMKDHLNSYMASTSYDNFITDVLSFRFQKSTKEKLNKIFPIRSIEIRNFSILLEDRKALLEGKEFKIKAKKPEAKPAAPAKPKVQEQG